MIGSKVNNYEILSLIGEGGMGNVYLAEDKSIGRKVAIKAILPHLSKNEHIRDRFMNELKTMSRLQHENIVNLHEYVINDDGLYLIMEYVDGDPLDTYIDRIGKPLEEDLAIEITKQVLSACEHAHSKGVVHRDIKPGNIMITKDGVAKILDFGIAKIVNEEVNKLTKTGLQIGTVYYMAPEQVQGTPVSYQTDIYAIGVTLYQMMTMRNPYKEFTTEFQIYKEIVETPLPNPTIKNPDASLFIHKVIQKATRKKPEERFKDCAEFLKVLDEQDKYGARYSGVTQTDPRPTKPAGEIKKKGNVNDTPIALALAGGIAGLVLALAGIRFCIFDLFAAGAVVYGLITANKYNKLLQTDESYSPYRSRIQRARTINIIAAIAILLSFILCLSIDWRPDDDGDGVPNEEDGCPYVAGTLNGCPDTDGDGIIDNYDKFYDVAGSPEHEGFPDSDGDGIPDKEDDCPDEEGYGGYGCPDSDEDGLLDKYDNCPEEYGPVSNNGCPQYDSDNDGVYDKDDNCPYTYGPEENDGCPYEDSDNDGVYDKDDDCPYTYGPRWNDGCPSSYSSRYSSGSSGSSSSGSSGGGYQSSGSGYSSGSSGSSGSSTTYSSKKYVKFTNNSSVATISVAVCYYNGTTWVTEGWYNVKRGKSETYPLPTGYASSRIYYSAGGGGYTWSGKGIPKCVSSSAFKYYDNIQNSCPKTEKFIEKKLTGTTTYVNFGD